MVAHTPTFCLPCFEGTDSPCLNTGTVCDPSTLWCDLVNILEGEFNSIDELLGRTVTAIPMASVTGTRIVDQSFPGTVIWDTVEYDTDNMVNLDVNATIVTPQRSGVYMVFGYVRALNSPAPSDGLEVKMYVLSGSDNITHATPTISITTEDLYITGQKPFVWTEGVSQPFSMAVEVIEVPLVAARLSVWWVCDI